MTLTSYQERVIADRISRHQSHCPHQRLTTSITHTLICQQCQLTCEGVLLVALNNRLNATILALAKLGLEPCATCHELFPTGELLLLPVNPHDGEHDDELLHRRFCAGDAVGRIEMQEIALTNDQLRWFGEHLAADRMPSWLREEMTERIGYRSLDQFTSEG